MKPLKKDLPFIINEKGFVFPFVLFVLSFIFMLLFFNLAQYESEITYAKEHIDEINMETLIQMTVFNLKRELKDNLEITNFKKSYRFPNGEVEATVSRESSHQYHYSLTIFTDNRTRYVKTGKIIITL